MELSEGSRAKKSSGSTTKSPPRPQTTAHAWPLSRLLLPLTCHGLSPYLFQSSLQTRQAQSVSPTLLSLNLLRPRLAHALLPINTPVTSLSSPHRLFTIQSSLTLPRASGSRLIFLLHTCRCLDFNHSIRASSSLYRRGNDCYCISTTHHRMDDDRSLDDAAIDPTTEPREERQREYGHAKCHQCQTHHQHDQAKSIIF